MSAPCIPALNRIVMKSFLLVTLGLSLPSMIGFAQPQRNEYPAEAAQSAQAFLQSVRSNVLDHLSELAKKDPLGSKDLETITSALDSGLRAIQDAHWSERLAAAANQIEIVRAQILTLASDPANKEVMALETDAPPWLRDIRLSQASAGILQTNMMRLRGTVEELRKCTLLLEPIEPPSLVSKKLQRRLQDLRAQWEQEIPAEDKSVMACDRQTDQKSQPLAPAGTGSESVLAVNLPSAAKRVLAMKQAGIEDRVIFQFIAGSQGEFQLSADDILFLRQKGVSEKIIVAMLKSRRAAG